MEIISQCALEIKIPQKIQMNCLKELFNSLIYSGNFNFNLFLHSFFFFFLLRYFFFTLPSACHKCHQWVCRVCAGIRRCTWVCVGPRLCSWMWVGVGGWDVFSEYLLETRFLKLANYNMHPLRIFSKEKYIQDWDEILARKFQFVDIVTLMKKYHKIAFFSSVQK